MSVLVDEPGVARIPENLGERLRDPEVAAALCAVLDKLDVIVLALDALDGLLAHSETVFDSVVDSVKDARTLAEQSPEFGALDLKASAGAGAQLIGALPRMAPALLRGVDSGAIDELTSEGLVEVLKIVSAGASEALRDPAPIELGGALAALRALRDPDTARGLSFFLTAARSVGRQLSANPNT